MHKLYHCHGHFILVLYFFLHNTVLCEGQDLSKQVTLPDGNMKLSKVLEEIHKQARVNFRIAPYLTHDVNKEVSVDGINNISAAAALPRILKETMLSFYPDGISVHLVLIPTPTVIRGIVIEEETGRPLKGAKIYLEDSLRYQYHRGTPLHAFTDERGQFHLTVLHLDTVHISYRSQRYSEMRIAGIPMDTVFQLRLVPQDEKRINAGYYFIDPIETTGNIASVKREQIGYHPVTSPLQSITGKMTGVLVEQKSGIAGTEFNVRIRGHNSFLVGNAPLYIIDGTPFPSSSIASELIGGKILPNSNPLNLIPNEVVERVDILKDADATALYGARGGNGVILITTLQVPMRGWGVSTSLSRGISQVANTMKLLTSEQYLEMRKEAFHNDEALMTKGNAVDILSWDTTRYTNWQRKLIGAIAPVTDANINAFGGGPELRVLINANFHQEGSVFPGNFKYSRAHFLVRLQGTQPRHNNFHNEITFQNTLAYNTQPMEDFTRFAVTLAPVAPALYDEQGEFNWQNDEWVNPITLLKKTYEIKSYYMSVHHILSIEPRDGLILKSCEGYSFIRNNEELLERYTGLSTLQQDNGQTGRFSYAMPLLSTLIWEPSVSYTHKIGKGITHVLAGSTSQWTAYESNTVVGTGYVADEQTQNIVGATNLYVYESKITPLRFQSFYMRLSYNYQRRYLVNVNLRRDGSNQFGPEKRFGNFASMSAGWIFTNEPFADQLPFISQGKLRSSYGITGNDQIGYFGYQRIYAQQESTYDGPVNSPIQQENPGYSYETIKKLEIGLELLFKDQVSSVELSYYDNRSTDLLLSRRMASTTGMSTMLFNMPAVIQNNGFELEFTTGEYEDPLFTWETQLNFTYPKNKILRYDNLELSNDARYYVVGEPVTIYRRYEAEVNPLTGSYQLIDQDGDNVLNDKDRSIKPVDVHYFGGLYTRLTFHRLECSIQFQYIKQTVLSYVNFFATPGEAANQPIEVMKRWRESGQFTDTPKFTQSREGVQQYRSIRNLSDVEYTDGSFLRLKNIHLAYRIPIKLPGIHESNVHVYVEAQNLFTFTRYIGLDPESVDPRILPPLRTILMGLKIEL